MQVAGRATLSASIPVNKNRNVAIAFDEFISTYLLSYIFFPLFLVIFPLAKSRFEICGINNIVITLPWAKHILSLQNTPWKRKLVKISLRKQC